MRRAALPLDRRVIVGLTMIAAGLMLGLSVGLASPAAAQSAPLTEIDAETEVRAIRFRFTDSQTFSRSELREHISHTARPALYGLRRALGFLPLIPPVGVHPFDPLDLARDAVRIERFYARSGFLFAETDWLVRLDSARNVVTILFTVSEGPPLLIESLDYVMPGGMLAHEQLAPELRPEWEAFQAEAGLQTGERLDEFRVIRLRDEALRWIRNRGYPFSRVTSRTDVDTLANRAAVAIIVDTGPRARIDEIIIEGNETVRDQAILRELPFRPGDLFSQRRLVEGQREVFELDIFQLALVDVPEQPVDETVTVRVRVREREAHGVTGQVGYFTEAGLTARAEWTHRNFLGDARTFRATAIANTGWIAFVEDPDRRYRANLSLRQPYVFSRHFSATGNVYAEWRDDFLDFSRGIGADATLLYERGQFRNASVSYTFEDRRVFRFRLGTGIPLVLPELDPIQDDDEQRVTNLSRSFFAANATYGQLDNALEPRSGFVIRPTAQITVPLPGTALRYARTGLTGTGYVPLGDRITFAGRANVGRLFPFADVTAEHTGGPLNELLRLRDVVFLAGGTNDVRGWGPGHLGPKVLNLDFTERELEGGGSAPGLTADRYFNFGGTMRTTATAEGRYRLTDTFGAFAFADAGRIWTPDPDFQVPPISPLLDRAYGETERFFAGVGAGLSLASPVGAVRVSVGMKVNPSFFDLRSAEDIAGAFQEVADAHLGVGWTQDEFIEHLHAFPQHYFEAAQGVPASAWRRFRLHIAIGQLF